MEIAIGVRPWNSSLEIDRCTLRYRPLQIRAPLEKLYLIQTRARRWLREDEELGGRLELQN